MNHTTLAPQQWSCGCEMVTMVTEVINEDDLVEKVRWRAVDHGGDGSEENCEGLIVEDDDH